MNEPVQVVVHVSMGWWSVVGPITGVMIGWLLSYWTTKKQNEREEKRWRMKQRLDAIVGCLRFQQEFDARLAELRCEPDGPLSRFATLQSELRSFLPSLFLLTRHAERPFKAFQDFPSIIEQQIQGLDSLDESLYTHRILVEKYLEINNALKKGIFQYISEDTEWNSSSEDLRQGKSFSFVDRYISPALKWIELKARAYLSKCK